MQAYLGSLYVNDFNLFGRTYQVNVQADAQYRQEIGDITQFKVRNSQGEMIPLGSFLNVEHSAGPDRVMHYNGYVTAEVNGAPAAGYSSDQAKRPLKKFWQKPYHWV
jgi:multidrug efflux pump